MLIFSLKSPSFQFSKFLRFIFLFFIENNHIEFFADIALCYYKLDFYDVSQEVLSVYLQKIPDSLIALNLKACNIYRLYNGRSAETEIRSLLVGVDLKCISSKVCFDEILIFLGISSQLSLWKRFVESQSRHFPKWRWCATSVATVGRCDS